MCGTEYTASGGRQERPWLKFVLAVGFALAAVWLRSRHLAWGLPDLEEEAFPMKKAFEMCGWGTGELRLNPETAGWPSLSFYVQMMVQHLQYWLGSMTGQFANRGDYFLQQMTWTPLAVWARWVSVLASSLVVFVGVRLGSHLAGWVGGLLTGAILLASPMLTYQTQLINPDILVVMFSALALGRIVRLEASGCRKDYLWAGVWVGLGISAKYTPLLLALVLYMAHVMQLRRAGLPLTRLGLDDRRLWWAALACVLAFALTSPYVMTDPNVLGRDVTSQVAHLKDGHFGHESQSMGLVFYVKNVLGPGLGWPAFLLGITGLFTAAWRLRGPWLVTLASFIVFYLALSLLKTRFDRYMLPALLPLALGSAAWWALLGPWLRQRGAGVALSGAAVLLVLVTTVPGLATSRILAQYAQPSTLEQAKTWLQAHRSEDGAYLAMELYSPAMPRAKQVSLRQNNPAFEHLTSEQQARWLDIAPVKVVYLPFYSTRRGASDFYYDLRHYVDYDFVVTSSAVRARYENSPDLYEQQVSFYQALDAVVPEVKIFAPDADRRGPEIRIYIITPASRAQIRVSSIGLAARDFRAAVPNIVGSHFQDFIKTVADHAAERRDFRQAARYYQPLYETLPPATRDNYLPQYATAVVQAELWDQAQPLLQRWRNLNPQNPMVAGYLGLTEAKRGQLVAAQAEFEACLQLAAGAPAWADLAKWARGQMKELGLAAVELGP